jgi:uncharacterized protein with HEPN domain
MLPELDRERFLHIQDAARKIASFVAGVTEEEFRKSDLLQHGIINCLYIVCEAATRISEDTRFRHQEIEWEVIRGMRNRLAHAYFDMNLSIIWYSATVDTPRLLEAVEQILTRE